MGPPRHLWSGDWRRESEAQSPTPPPANAPREAMELSDTQRPGLPGRDSGVRSRAGARKPSRRTMIATAAAVLLALAIGVPLATLGGSTPARQATTPYVQATPYASPNNGVYTIPQAIPAPTTPQQHTGP